MKPIEVPAPYRIRPLHRGDLDGTSRVHWRACRLAYGFMDWSYGLDEVRAWYAAKIETWDWGLVTCDEGMIVAYIAAIGGHVDQLFVDPDHQRRGLGSALLGAMLARGLRPATLCVHADNAPARALYERFGFRQVDAWWDGQDRAQKLRYRLDDQARSRASTLPSTDFRIPA